MDGADREVPVIGAVLLYRKETSKDIYVKQTIAELLPL
jgi:hypothetical protein